MVLQRSDIHVIIAIYSNNGTHKSNYSNKSPYN